jgi:hypothetical protein
VVKLVKDRKSREPLAPWPEMHPDVKLLLRKGLEAGVSFAARGNLVMIAPPLVIGEQELADALGLLDRLIGELEAGFTQPMQRPSPQPSPATGRGGRHSPRPLPAKRERGKKKS